MTMSSTRPSIPFKLRQSAILLVFKISLLHMILSMIIICISIFWQSIRITEMWELFTHITYQVFIFISIFLIQTIMTVLIVARWLTEYYEIKKGEIIYSSGIFFNKQNVFYLQNIETITLKQGFWERLLDYGSIELHSSFMNKNFYLESIPHPHKYVQIIDWAMPEKTQVAFITRKGKQTI
jgi:membrane protein YdbS with pleckstrin-like domain